MSLKKIMKLVFLPSLVNDIKQAMSLIAMEFYGHPEKQLKLLAFTGTKGKTTSAYLHTIFWNKVTDQLCCLP